MSCQMVHLLADSHHMLEAMHRLRLEGHLCDVTVQVDFQGELEEFEVHQVVLAASSGYFSGILLARDAPKKLFLSNMHTTDFANFLEYVYTGKVEIPQNKIGDVHEMSKLLDCKMLTDACCMVLNTGSSTSELLMEAPSRDTELDSDGTLKLSQKSSVKKLPRRAWMKRPLSPKSAESGEASPKRATIKVTSDRKKYLRHELQSRRLSNRLAGRKVFVGLPKKRRLKEMTAAPLENMDPDAPGSSQEEEALAEREEEEEKEEEDEEEEDTEKLLEADHQEEDPEDDADDPMYLSMDEEEGEAQTEGGRRRRSSKRGDTQYKCEKCQRTFLYEKSYIKHISMSHGLQADVIYRCETCQQTFANRGNLKIHERHVHNDDRLFSCEVCAKTFKRKKDVIRHQRQVHEGGAGAMRHVCPICCKSLSSRTALTLHERTHTGDKPFECPDCQAKFSQRSALKTHRRIHTGEKPFACDQCDARFNQKHMLCYHKRSHTGEKPFMCESCGKSFASKEYLRHHANIHTGSRPYKCEVCGRGFAQRNSLHQHMKTHTGERPYSCSFCDKNFTQLNALQRHQRIHTGEKPYMCGLCNRTFTDKSTVRRHTMTHDMDAPWKNYLVVLKGNVEDKKPKMSPKVKVPRPGHEEGGAGLKAGAGTKVQEGAMVVPAMPVALSADWAGTGTIALVSHPGLGGITVIQTEVPAGTQIQPIVTTDSTGNSILSLESSAGSIPFSIPVSIAHSISASSAGAMLAQVSQPSAVPTASVLETVVSQTILAPVSVAASDCETVILDGEDEVVAESASVSGEDCITVQVSDLETEGEQSCTAESSIEVSLL